MDFTCIGTVDYKYGVSSLKFAPYVRANGLDAVTAVWFTLTVTVTEKMYIDN